MAKKNLKKSSFKWDSKQYYNCAVYESLEKQYALLVIKIIQSKALDRKDAEEFVAHYLRQLYREMHGYDFVRTKEYELNQLIRDIYS